MKRKILIILAVLIITVVLFVPFSISHYDDGGSVKITALTYSVVKWNTFRIVDTSQYEQGEPLPRYRSTCVYLFPNNFKTPDELWEIKH